MGLDETPPAEPQAREFVPTYTLTVGDNEYKTVVELCDYDRVCAELSRQADQTETALGLAKRLTKENAELRAEVNLYKSLPQKYVTQDRYDKLHAELRELKECNHIKALLQCAKERDGLAAELAEWKESDEVRRHALGLALDAGNQLIKERDEALAECARLRGALERAIKEICGLEFRNYDTGFNTFEEYVAHLAPEWREKLKRGADK